MIDFCFFGEKGREDQLISRHQQRRLHNFHQKHQTLNCTGQLTAGTWGFSVLLGFFFVRFREALVTKLAASVFYIRLFPLFVVFFPCGVFFRVSAARLQPQIIGPSVLVVSPLCFVQSTVDHRLLTVVCCLISSCICLANTDISLKMAGGARKKERVRGESRKHF